MEPTEESFTEPCDLAPGNTFQKRSVSSPVACVSLSECIPSRCQMLTGHARCARLPEQLLTMTQAATTHMH